MNKNNYLQITLTAAVIALSALVIYLLVRLTTITEMLAGQSPAPTSSPAPLAAASAPAQKATSVVATPPSPVTQLTSADLMSGEQLVQYLQTNFGMTMTRGEGRLSLVHGLPMKSDFAGAIVTSDNQLHTSASQLADQVKDVLAENGYKLTEYEHTMGWDEIHEYYTNDHDVLLLSLVWVAGDTPDDPNSLYHVQLEYVATKAQIDEALAQLEVPRQVAEAMGVPSVAITEVNLVSVGGQTRYTAGGCIYNGDCWEIYYAYDGHMATPLYASYDRDLTCHEISTKDPAISLLSQADIDHIWQQAECGTRTDWQKLNYDFSSSWLDMKP